MQLPRSVASAVPWFLRGGVVMCLNKHMAMKGGARDTDRQPVDSRFTHISRIIIVIIIIIIIISISVISVTSNA